MNDIKPIDIAIETYKHKKYYFENYMKIAKKIKKFLRNKIDKNARVIVFGSVVKGNYIPLSDLDILIITNKIKRDEYAKVFTKIKKHLKDLFAPIEFHIVNEETFNNRYKKFLDKYVEV
ncbi:MAG: nucleotidyltransferase domain-containing protein [Candidatus Aenigmatarchaeota archaeon]